MSHQHGKFQEDPITNAVNAYTDHQQLVQRICSVVASCVSIVFGLFAFYLFVNMRKKVFRHHLIFLLLTFDFGKAVVLLWYPVRVLQVKSSYNNVNFCEIVGYFTCCFIEGADLAVLALALQTGVVVYKKDTGAMGGLYPWRKYVYATVICVPILLASLAFIDRGRTAYVPMVTWCYLPAKPYWYRLVLSWVPRYCILIIIIAIYVSIYIHVKREYDTAIRNFQASQSYIQKTEDNSVAAKFRRFGKKCVSAISYLPGLGFLDTQKFDTDELIQQQLVGGQTQLSPQEFAIQEFQMDQLRQFKDRRTAIERQVRTIFVYPVAYVFLWIAPFALQALQFHYVFHHGTVFWIAAVASFMQPFNLTVDTVAFCIQEKPWRNSEERVFTKRNAYRLKRWLCMCNPFVQTPGKLAPRSVVGAGVVTVDEVVSRDEHVGTPSEVTASSTSTTPPTGHQRHKTSFESFDDKNNGISTADKTADTLTETDVEKHNNPFEMTHNRVESDGDNSEGEMDLMEFLR
ncbi:G protein-coupled receptor GPR1 [Yarrowia sp. B02]|nr:G protein-coupled receptor GPR1 [Yarrowia sp. B02]